MCKCGRGEEYFSVRDGVKCVFSVCMCECDVLLFV